LPRLVEPQDDESNAASGTSSPPPFQWEETFMSTPLIASTEPQFQTIDGLGIRNAESGGSYGRTVLLASPWQESIYAFAPTWAELAAHARLFAVDLPGFRPIGRSSGARVSAGDGRFLAQLVAKADLGTPHIVAPDVGTSAALFAAAEHPERFASVIVGTRGAAVSLKARRAIGVVGARPGRRQDRRMDSRAIVGATLDTIAGGYPTTSARTTSPATTATASSTPETGLEPVTRRALRRPRESRIWPHNARFA
jgi:pimeloyl-ACP methyl ester carboxylesterase